MAAVETTALLNTDLALAPVIDSEMDTLNLFHHTEAAEAFTARERRPEVARVAVAR